MHLSGYRDARPMRISFSRAPTDSLAYPRRRRPAAAACGSKLIYLPPKSYSGVRGCAATHSIGAIYMNLNVSIDIVSRPYTLAPDVGVLSYGTAVYSYKPRRKGTFGYCPQILTSKFGTD